MISFLPTVGFYSEDSINSVLHIFFFFSALFALILIVLVNEDKK